MAAPESTKLQVNFNLPDGTLVNAYATNVKEMETSLVDIQMLSALIKTTSFDLSNKAPAVTAEAVATNLNATVVATPQVVVEGQSPNCKHGIMVYRTGQSARGPWRGWMCASPKGAPDKCPTIWA